MIGFGFLMLGFFIGGVSRNILQLIAGLMGLICLYIEMEKLGLLKDYSYFNLKRGSTGDTWENQPTCDTLSLKKDELFEFRKRLLKDLYRRKLYSMKTVNNFLELPWEKKIKAIRKLW